MDVFRTEDYRARVGADLLGVCLSAVQCKVQASNNDVKGFNLNSAFRGSSCRERE
jgi:hypothetical protein